MGASRKNLLLIAIGAPWFMATASIADPGVSSVAQSTTPDIAVLERRYFGRVYDKDATDKRIQRLELLLFGATQDGGMVERLDRIQESAAEHAKPAKSNLSLAADTASIAVLERKILKKSFDAETPIQRLGRLESKVFGQASPSMSIGDRVFRLKKILNIDTPSISRLPVSPELGGMGRLGLDNGNNDLSSPFNSFSYAPFAGGHGDEMAQQMNEMIKQLNKSLRGIHRLPDGAPNVSPFSGPNVSPFSRPNGTPFVQPFRVVPQQNRDTELPPYLDPNSI